MRYLLILLLLGPLSGCLIIEDELFFADDGRCAAPGAYAPPTVSTAEPPRAGPAPIVQTSAGAPAQTREPPR